MKLTQSRSADTLALGIFETKTLDVPIPGAPEVLYKGGPYGMNGVEGVLAKRATRRSGHVPDTTPPIIDPVPQRDYIRRYWNAPMYKGGMGCAGSCGCSGSCRGVGGLPSLSSLPFADSPAFQGVVLAGAAFLLYKTLKKRSRR